MAMAWFPGPGQSRAGETAGMRIVDCKDVIMVCPETVQGDFTGTAARRVYSRDAGRLQGGTGPGISGGPSPAAGPAAYARCPVPGRSPELPGQASRTSVNQPAALCLVCQAESAMKERFIVFLMQGTRPLRILIFGGIFLAWLVMILLAWLLNIETDIGGEIVFENVMLIAVSLLIGFGAAFRIFRFLENARYEREPPDRL